MTCVYPLDGWRTKSPNESGKYGLTFSADEASLDEPLAVACGKCIGCRRDQARDWGIRCYHESVMHSKNAFVTLTYAMEPTDFSVVDLQLFLKRLRKFYTRFRYFACGEYGTLSGRAHYHALIFGQDFREVSYAINDSLYGNPCLDSIWGKGLASVGSVTPESCFYTAGYCQKKIDSESFSVMSRRPGIGRSFLDKYQTDLLSSGTCVVGSREMPVPKRYFEWAHLDKVQDRRKEFVRRMSPEDRWTKRVQLRGIEQNYLADRERKLESV